MTQKVRPLNAAHGREPFESLGPRLVRIDVAEFGPQEVGGRYLACRRVAAEDLERLVGNDPDDTQLQINLVTTYVDLAIRGDDTMGRFRSAVEILRALKAAQKLSPKQENILAVLEAQIARSPPP